MLRPRTSFRATFEAHLLRCSQLRKKPIPTTGNSQVFAVLGSYSTALASVIERLMNRGLIFTKLAMATLLLRPPCPSNCTEKGKPGMSMITWRKAIDLLRIPKFSCVCPAPISSSHSPSPIRRRHDSVSLDPSAVIVLRSQCQGPHTLHVFTCRRSIEHHLQQCFCRRRSLDIAWAHASKKPLG